MSIIFHLLFLKNSKTFFFLPFPGRKWGSSKAKRKSWLPAHMGRIQNDGFYAERQYHNLYCWIDLPKLWDSETFLTYIFLHGCGFCMYAQVVNETLRLMNIPPGLLRKALKDINIKGMYAYALIAMNPLFVINYIYSLMELIDRFTFTFRSRIHNSGWVDYNACYSYCSLKSWNIQGSIKVQSKALEGVPFYISWKPWRWIY